MLSLLLDEQISPHVASALSLLNPEIKVTSIYDWRDGALTGTEDDQVLHGAAEDALTLVTYDLKTIPPLLAEWAVTGKTHGGVIFVDTRSIAPSDFGGLARALLFCWETQSVWEWANRIVYLKPV